MHHKRHKPKNARAGCIRAKPHKANGANDNAPAVKRAPGVDEEWYPVNERERSLIDLLNCDCDDCCSLRVTRELEVTSGDGWALVEAA